jgi:hypothetical protein
MEGRSIVVNVKPKELAVGTKDVSVTSERACMSLTFTPLSLPCLPGDVEHPKRIPPPTRGESLECEGMDTDKAVTIRGTGR